MPGNPPRSPSNAARSHRRPPRWVLLDDDEDEQDNDQELIELQVERVQRDQEAEIGDDENPDLEEDTPDTEESKVWYEKIKPLVDHMRVKSQDLIFILGTFLALDEMMIRFMGRSVETHRMKNKPIKEGFKFFVLAISTGFVFFNRFLFCRGRTCDQY